MTTSGRGHRGRTVTAALVDPGLQPERTTLAWSRTGLALVTTSAIFLRWVPHYGPWMLALPAVTLVLALVITITQASRTNRAVHGIHGQRISVNPASQLLLVGILLGLGVAGIGFVVHA